MKLEDDPPFIGDWYREKKLGSGSFGLVTLWKNKKTNQSVAIKKSHLINGKGASNESKQRERWENEVDLMNDRVKNENIVKTVKIQPNSFLIELMKTNPSGLPLLIMEYCEGGDLRRTLFKTCNSSGLIESEVRSILKSLRNAISYLHTLKITHRDIKPENIVLQKCGDVIVYKLTDLGYAKNLDMNSLNASLVGTMEYLAPELLHSNKYNNSVDYWPMGIIGFEVICGTRPFLPHASIAQCIVQVQQKKSEHICITETVEGQYRFLNRLFPENRCSTVFQRMIEKWLMLALEWNSKQRGFVFEIPTQEKTGTKVSFAENVSGPAPVQTLKIFTMLDEILSKKIITVYSLFHYDFFSFIIDENTTLTQFMESIEESTGINKTDIEIILPLEQSIDKIEETTKPIDLFIENFYESPMLFIVKKPILTFGKSELILSEQNKPNLPENLQKLFENDKIKLKPQILKHFASNACYFVRQEHKVYKNFINGLKDYTLQLNHEITVYKNHVSDMMKKVFSLRGSIDLYSSTLDETKNKLQTSEDKINQTFVFWDEQKDKIKINITKLCDGSDKITTRFDSVLRRSRESVTNKIFESILKCDFYDLNRLDKLFEEIRGEILNKKVHEKSHTKLLKFVYDCLKERDSLLRNEELNKLQQNIVNIKIEYDEIKKAVEMAFQQTEKYQNDVNKINSDHHEKLWTLMETQIKSTSTNNLSNGYALPDFTSMLNSLQISTEYEPRHFQIGSQVKPEDMLCFGEGPDLKSLIADNESIIMATSGLIEDGFKSLQEYSIINN